MNIVEVIVKVQHLVSMANYYYFIVPSRDMRPELYEAIEELKRVVEYINSEEVKANHVSTSEQQKPKK